MGNDVLILFPVPSVVDAAVVIDGRFRYHRFGIAETADSCTHWGRVVVSPVRTLQTHRKEMDNVPTKNWSGTSQTHSGFSKPV